MAATLDTDRASWGFEAIGTAWQIDSAGPLDEPVRAQIEQQIARFDREWSRFRSDSLVAYLARGAAEVQAPADASAMLDLYRQLSDATHGAVNPLVGGVLARRGYDAGYSLVDRGPEAAPVAWQRQLRWSDESLALNEPAMIDVGALGKGRLVDLVADLVSSASSAPFVVDASGDLIVRGSTEPIALEHPFDATRAIGVWEVRDAALCASAGNRRAWPGIDGSGLHHILDARTGEPVRTVVASWALATDAMTADAAATALFFEGGEKFAADCGVEWIRMLSDGRVEWSHGCKAELFS